LSIAAASILAKTAREEHMRRLDLQYPGYGFSVHKGYGTRAHCLALQALGPSPIHRSTFHLKNTQSPNLR
jgi:ribonuclease HII